MINTYCWMLSYLNNFISARRQTRESCWGVGKAEKRLLEMAGKEIERRRIANERGSYMVVGANSQGQSYSGSLYPGHQATRNSVGVAGSTLRAIIHSNTIKLHK
jgi:hypothetical protein